MSQFLGGYTWSPDPSMYPARYPCKPIQGNPDEYRAQMEEIGSRWLASKTAYGAERVYHHLREVVVPEFINVYGDCGAWRIPHNPERLHEMNVIAVMLTKLEPRWTVVAVGVDECAFDIFLQGRLTDIELHDIRRGRFPASLARLGKPGAGVCEGPPQRQLAGRTQRPPNHRGFPGADPIFATHTIHRHPDEHHPLDHQYQPGIFHHGAHDMAGRQPQHRTPMAHPRGGPLGGPMVGPMGKPTGGGMVGPTARPRGRGSYVAASSDSSLSSSSSSDSDSDSDSSSPERSPKKKKKPTKSKKPMKKFAKRRSSLVDDEDGSADERPQAKRSTRPPAAKPTTRRRGRSPDDDEEAAPPPPPRAAGPSKAQRPPPKPGGHEKQDGNGSEDEGPPPMDPAEKARLDALKAKNGYGNKPEKSGWH
ncbi:MAG: hypothetical protein Q9222_005409 [Ikaeria aurantiellina]